MHKCIAVASDSFFLQPHSKFFLRLLLGLSPGAARNAEQNFGRNAEATEYQMSGMPNVALHARVGMPKVLVPNVIYFGRPSAGHADCSTCTEISAA